MYIYIWYLDDDTFIGPRPAIAQLFHLLQSRGPSFGLLLNPTKCEVFWPSGDQKFSEFPSEVQRVVGSVGGVEFLGSPVFGSEEYYCGHIAKRVDKVLQCQEKLLDMDDPQIQLLLLRSCLSSCKINNLLRTVPPNKGIQQLAKFDSNLRVCLDAIIRCSTSDMSWLQASLPVRQGGLGLREAVRMSSSAFIGSCNSVRSLCSRLLPTTPLLEESVLNSNYSSPDFSAFPGESAAKDHIRSLVPDSLDTIDLTSSSRRNLQRLLDTKLSTTILEKASLRDRARLNTISAPHAGAWLRAIPNPNLSLAMPQREEFIIAVRTCLGIPFFPPPPSSKRCSCGQVLDSYGDHLLGCGEGNWRNRRHNVLADVAFEALLSDNANLSS